MLGNAAPTPFDLRFSLFGIPVRVHPLFWLFSAIMGWSPRDPNLMFIWIGCVFVSILVHEMGHALTARAFGWEPNIVLYTFGGYAAFRPTWGYTMPRAVLTLFAGPGAGFALYGAVVAAELIFVRQGWLHNNPRRFDYLATMFRQLKFINLWWGLVNLLPVYPLDGGQISRELLMHFRGRSGLDISLKLSILVGGAAAAWFFMHDLQYAGILFALLAFESFQHLGGMRYR